MSISNELIILNSTKQNIRTSINLKGVSVTDEAFSVYPDKVRLIPNGGGIYESNIIQYIEGTMVDVNIPSGTTTIGKSAFYLMPIETVTIPNSVTSIGSFSFFGCQYLDSVTIPNTVTSIGNSTFHDCTSLTTIDIPNSVTSIGDNAFKSCTSLTSITCEATTPPTLGYDALGDTNNCPIYVPDNSVLAYQTADNWMQYSNRITPLSDKPQ